ncbi:hypothetical protein [Neptunicella sp. SCSIO 80796]|uniref:hypothetical protein n=1 Tax=Neptunicella plasticusilytica TaxID=3117012 RepID=UPI003A4E34D2
MQNLWCKFSYLSLVFVLNACGQPQPVGEINEIRPADLRSGTRFLPLSENAFTLPAISEIPISVPSNADAIWGALGSDDNGNLYFGVSTHGGDQQTSYLYQLNPVNNQITLQGDTLSQLKKSGLYRDGMGQNKLHSKIYQADDGYLYFSSFDEEGESEGINPIWGGHLWRKLPQSRDWHHVLATEEALIAINTNGRYIYALGYWDHMLYQYDTQNANVNRVKVGSVATHVSRNLLVDHDGHVYVPSISQNDFNQITVQLNEYDTHLNLVDSYPMPSYQHKNISRHHGIVGYTSMANQHIFFTTGEGGLYELNPFAEKQEKLVFRGNIHPNGQSYAPSLFTFEGRNFLVSMARATNSKQFDWVIYELLTDTSVIYPTNLSTQKRLLYGSLTKDNKGNLYLGGRLASDSNTPILVKLTF